MKDLGVATRLRSQCRWKTTEHLRGRGNARLVPTCSETGFHALSSARHSALHAPGAGPMPATGDTQEQDRVLGRQELVVWALQGESPQKGWCHMHWVTPGGVFGGWFLLINCFSNDPSQGLSSRASRHGSVGHVFADGRVDAQESKVRGGRLQTAAASPQATPACCLMSPGSGRASHSSSPGCPGFSLVIIVMSMFIALQHLQTTSHTLSPWDLGEGGGTMLLPEGFPVPGEKGQVRSTGPCAACLTRCSSGTGSLLRV